MLQILNDSNHIIKEKLWITIKSDFPVNIINELLSFSSVTGVRFNLSKEKNLQKVVSTIKLINAYTPRKYIMIDFGGVKQRVRVEGDRMETSVGQEIIFTSCLREELQDYCDRPYIHVSSEFMEYARATGKVGDLILVSDGWQQFQITSIDKNLYCKALTTDPLYNNRGISIKGLYDHLNQNYDGDIEKLRYLYSQGCYVDYVALSFSVNEFQIKNVRERMKDFYAGKILAKIETVGGVKNCMQIAGCCEGIMLGRGDLLVELSYEGYDMLNVEKFINSCCKLLNKEFILATRVADSLETEVSMTPSEVLVLNHEIKFMKINTFLLSNETTFNCNKSVGNLEKVISTIRLIENDKL